MVQFAPPACAKIGPMFQERREVKRGQLPNGKWLTWTEVSTLDGQGVPFSMRRELFTVNYEPVADDLGLILLRQLGIRT